VIRRQLIALLGGAAAWPVAARAQQTERVRRIGVLMGMQQNDPEAGPRVTAFERRLQELGWTGGRNVRVDYRWSSDDSEKLRAEAVDLIALAPQLVVADSTAALTMIRPLARGLPVVFLRVSDPVAAGFVDSLAHPGGTITGITNFEYAMGGKWLELLKQIAPHIARITALTYPGMTAHAGLWETIKVAAPKLGLEAKAVSVRTGVDIEGAILAAAGEPDHGLVLLPHAIVEINWVQIIAAAARQRLPAIYPLRHFAAAGGLIAYGLEPLDLYRQAAVLVDRILRGAKPADLPVMQPIKYELAINLKTSQALSLIVPDKLLALADEVIE
jgi:putative tryptophan/tyrosine transport system substrate-binding protein